MSDESRIVTKVRRQNLPPALFQHLLDRIQRRKIPAFQLEPTFPIPSSPIWALTLRTGRAGAFERVQWRSDVAHTTSTFAREQMRRWTQNWRVVNEVQDELVRAEPVPDAAGALEAGLSLMAFAREVREADPQLAAWREAGEDSVRCTWQRLRAAHVR